jgi:hypothetical protein
MLRPLGPGAAVASPGRGCVCLFLVSGKWSRSRPTGQCTGQGMLSQSQGEPHMKSAQTFD